MGAPFFNLVTLLWSSGTLNVARGCLRVGKRDRAIMFLVATLVLGAIFE